MAFEKIGAALAFAMMLLSAQGATLCVSTNSQFPGVPYNDWTNAARDIQTAIDAATAGDTIWVTNGVYDAGGRTVEGQALTNRVAIDRLLTVRSVNGPLNTFIVGAVDPVLTNGNAAVRCVYLTTNAGLIGFTLTNGYTLALGGIWGNYVGGGVWCADSNAVISNCVITGNGAVSGGGGYQGTYRNCVISGNRANTYGGGVYWGIVYDSVISGNAAGYEGGGSHNTRIYNSSVIGNAAGIAGGGAYGGWLYNSVFANNSAVTNGGGVYGATLYNCTVTDNSAKYGGGADLVILHNCIVYFNGATLVAPNIRNGTVYYSCSTPLPSGPGNIADDPLLVNRGGGDYRLQTNSPCINAGTNQTWMSGATDLDGNARIRGNFVDMGACEFQGTNPAALIVIGKDGGFLANNTAASEISGTALQAVKGFPVTNTLTIQNRGFETLSILGITTNGTGASCFSLVGMTSSLDVGQSASFQVVFDPSDLRIYAAAMHVAHNASNTASPFVLNLQGIGKGSATRYVVKSNPGAQYPYSNWVSAAAGIQDAADVAMDGDTIWVSNGVYNTGGRKIAAVARTNRVAVERALAVRSVNGPDVTSIVGRYGTYTSDKYGGDAIQCIYLTNNAFLDGFTLTNGYGNYGGGIYCASASATVSNCVISGNSVNGAGAGGYRGTYHNCTITGNGDVNTGSGGGAYWANLFNCILVGNTASDGGGAYAGVSSNCAITGNSATHQGGGAYVGEHHNGLFFGNTAPTEGGGVYNGNLYGCLLSSNTAPYGGGTYQGNLYNCTLVGNTAGTEGGGAMWGNLMNCISYYNVAPTNANYRGQVDYSCTTPLPQFGAHNTTNAPLFVDYAGGNFRLPSNSPCINTGTNEAWMTGAFDLDAQPRIFGGGRVDMGAYEYQASLSIIPTNWLADYLLPIDGSADFADNDNDTYNNWAEWRAGTIPTNNQSFFHFQQVGGVAASGLVIRWPSITGRTYALDRSMNLMLNPAFTNIVAGIEGQMDSTMHTDTTAVGSGPWTYRIELE